MARTTDAAVKLIIEVDTNIALDSFIEAANALVTELCADYYDATRLELIERWLSAHFYTVRDMRAEMEKADDVTQKLQSKVDLGFDTSHYDQMAMRLDTEGLLAGLNERIKAGKAASITFSWLGTEEADATNPGD